MNFDNLNKRELKELLKNLILYRDLVKKIWKRWKKIFSQINDWKNSFVVEFFPKLDKNFVLEKSKKIFEEVFWQKNLNNEEIILKENEKIWWWMRLFFNDQMVDLSFLRMKNLIKNN